MNPRIILGFKYFLSPVSAIDELSERMKGELVYGRAWRHPHLPLAVAVGVYNAS